jgi:hypothetical protein
VTGCPGSKTFSRTLAPTFQDNRFFARVEFSFVKALDTTPGFVFRPTFPRPRLNETPRKRTISAMEVCHGRP